MLKTKKYIVYILKHNSKHEKQGILLTNLNGEGWNYLANKNTKNYQHY